MQELLHPDTACAMLGYCSRPGEGAWAKYERRRNLKALGLTRVVGKFKGYRYYAHEVQAAAAQHLHNLPKKAA
jgi:hypothetical protein